MAMVSDAPRLSARRFIEGLAAAGRYHFDSSEARSSLAVSAAAVKLALNRLAKQKLIASPARGFYVIVPPEYRALGCLPGDQFIPALMKRRSLPYYIGLLSAAQYHGAAHQRPQVFQVFLGRKRRPIACGSVRVTFMVHRNLGDIPVQAFNTPRGTVAVSTPEATALDLVGYQRRAGGLNQVATVLAELAERIDAEKLTKAAAVVPVPWSQRLGYLLEHVGAGELTGALRAYVHTHARASTALLPGSPHQDAPRHDDWKLYVNAAVETQL
jgi:predicted transcriptional regulator of viral defense system